MFALQFTFPANRYHGTPWGRRVNEAAVDWPPEPWRILRAMIASYWRTDRGRHDGDTELGALIDALAGILPVYSVPVGGIHAHTRHYMPIRKGRGETTTLIFDAFIHLPDGATLVAAWPGITLTPDLYDLASTLASGLSYLGRSESWVECSAVADWAGEANCTPARPDDETQPIEMLAALPEITYTALRQRLIGTQTEATEDGRDDESTRRVASSASNTEFCTRSGISTLPTRLLDALMLETADYKECGWSRPPASRSVPYTLHQDAAPRTRPAPRSRSTPTRSGMPPTVARYLLVGRPRPTVFDSVKIGELMRLAALSQFGWTMSPGGRKLPAAPWQLSGRGGDGKPISDPTHPHAFWLPEDADCDGLIDHVSVYVAAGIPSEIQERLQRVRRLWTSRGEATTETAERPHTDEWLLALEGFAHPGDFAAAAPIFRASRTWRSATPFIPSGHLGPAGHGGEIRRLLVRRHLDTRLNIDARDVTVSELRTIPVANSPRSPLHFHRFRSRRGERHGNRPYAFVEANFPAEVQGPLALGYGSHFGLGQFVPSHDEHRT